MGIKHAGSSNLGMRYVRVNPILYGNQSLKRGRISIRNSVWSRILCLHMNINCTNKYDVYVERAGGATKGGLQDEQQQKLIHMICIV